MAAAFGVLGDLVQHQPVRHRPGAVACSAGFLGLRRHPLRRRSSATAALRDPGLADIPLRRAGLFKHHPMVYLAIARLPSPGLVLYRTRAGLVLRSVGESPESAHALGYPVRRIRLAAVMVRRRCAAWPAPTSRWSTRRCGSRAWSPAGLDRAGADHLCHLAAGAGAAGRLPVRRRSPCCSSTCRARCADPSQCLTMLPYLATIVVLALISRNAA